MDIIFSYYYCPFRNKTYWGINQVIECTCNEYEKRTHIKIDIKAPMYWRAITYTFNFFFVMLIICGGMMFLAMLYVSYDSGWDKRHTELFYILAIWGFIVCKLYLIKRWIEIHIKNKAHEEARFQYSKVSYQAQQYNPYPPPQIIETQNWNQQQPNFRQILFCPHCGNRLEILQSDSQKFCYHCGRQIIN